MVTLKRCCETGVEHCDEVDTGDDVVRDEGGGTLVGKDKGDEVGGTNGLEVEEMLGLGEGPAVGAVVGSANIGDVGELGDAMGATVGDGGEGQEQPLPSHGVS